MCNDSPSDALAILPVSRETIRRLTIHREMLLKWRLVKNLVGPATVSEVWKRHFADSLQLRRLEPTSLNWVDIGSGAGFPGLVIAADLADNLGAMVHLVESDHRRCAFLREAARAMGAKVTIHCGRAEDILVNLSAVDIVTARAVAPLHKLVDLASPLLDKGAKCLFLKGRGYAAELTEVETERNLTLTTFPSLTDPASAVIKVTGNFSPRMAGAKGI